MVRMSLQTVCLTGIWRNNSEISSRGSTGNLLIWMALSSDFLLIKEKALPHRQENVITLRVDDIRLKLPGRDSNLRPID